MGRAVVADKTEHQVVGQESGGEEQQHLQIGAGHLKYFLVRPGQAGERAGKEDSRRQKYQGQNRRQGQQGGKKPVGLLARRLTFQDRIADGASHAQHQPAAVDQIEAGNGQIEGGQAGLAKPLGHKKGVGQDIAGDPHHSQHIQAGVPEKFAKQRGF